MSGLLISIWQNLKFICGIPISIWLNLKFIGGLPIAILLNLKTLGEKLATQVHKSTSTVNMKNSSSNNTWKRE